MSWRPARVVLFLIAVAAVPVPLPAAGHGAPPEDGDDKRPIELADILDWKRIRSARVSDDGAWFAYSLAPNEGDSEIVVRSIGSENEYRFGAGELPMFGGATMAFSNDSRWFAFEILPSAEDKKRARGAGGGGRRGASGGTANSGGGAQAPKKKVGLVDLGSGEITRFDDVRAFAIAGEEAPWLALHRYAPDSRDSGASGMGGARGTRRMGDDPDSGWKGTDLLLRRLDDGVSMAVGNVSEFAFNDSGALLAMAIDTEDRAGNGLQLRELATGRTLPLDSGEASYVKLGWTEEGDALAVLRGFEDDGYDDELYAVLGFRDLDQGQPARVTYDPAADDSFPEGMTISPNHAPEWNEARDALVFRIHEPKVKESGKRESDGLNKNAVGDAAEGEQRQGPVAREEDLDTADLVIWHWRDRRLQSRQQVQEQRDRRFGYLSTYRIDENRFIRLADESVRDMDAAPKQRFAIGTDNAPYERLGNLDGRRYQDVYVVDMSTGERRLALQENRWMFGPSPDGRHFLYFNEGNFHAYDMQAGASVNLTADLPVPFWNEEDDHNVVMPPVYPFGLGWSDRGDSVLLSDNWDIWKIAADGSDAVNLTADGRDKAIRYRRAFRLDPDADGIEIDHPVYVTAYGEWTKKGGIARLDPARPGAEMLVWDDASFGGLLKAEDADVFLYTRETYADYPDYRVAGADLGDATRITVANPQQDEFKWSAGVRLVDYTSAKGDKLQGALYLPADYEPGNQYPTVVYIYEKLSQRANYYQGPTANGFNKSAYTSNGYAVFMPDIVYEVDDPGMSSVWCVVPAVDAAIQTGIVDPDAVGLHGHSWGGYQTSFLITQTDRFSAAIAGAPLTNMISMYSLIYKNSGGGNGAIFESSQGRFTGGPWDVPEAYVRNSPVYHATNVTTPLILLHNDLDGAVDFTQGVEYYNTLRRLDKNVVLLEYVGENHGLRKPANRKDYTVRMKEFFDHYLRDIGMPVWLQDGVPYLKLEDHLEERARAIADELERAKAAADKGEVGDAGVSATRGEQRRPDRRRNPRP